MINSFCCENHPNNSLSPRCIPRLCWMRLSLMLPHSPYVIIFLLTSWHGFPTLYSMSHYHHTFKISLATLCSWCSIFFNNPFSATWPLRIWSVFCSPTISFPHRISLSADLFLSHTLYHWKVVAIHFGMWFSVLL